MEYTNSQSYDTQEAAAVGKARCLHAMESRISDEHKYYFIVDELPKVRGNRIHVRILLQNLIANALKYHKEGSHPVVSISSSVDESADLILIHINDNGIGIATEHQSGIFEIFKRLHANSVYPGTGMGLAICERIAVSHGGDVSVVSTVDEGSTFTASFKR